MIKLELSSYPKSGNTWFRHIVQDYFSILNKKEYYYPPDIHESENNLNDYKAQNVKFINKDIFVYKSHVFNDPNQNPNKIIHIFRHPLDVFLSSRMHLFNRSVFMSDRRKKSYFLNGIPKTVDDVIRDNEMDYYFDEFIEDLGITYYNSILGDKSNYFSYVLSALKSNLSVSIKYEDLVNKTNETTNFAFQSYWPNIPSIKLNNSSINKKTKFSGDSFYWKSRAENFKHYLTAKQIKKFSMKYGNELSLIGYH